MSSFRFSLIYPEYAGTKRQWSYFKRFTYFVSPELTNKTFFQQIGEGDFSSLQKIQEAFSVDPVTKQFYNELQSWYFWAMDKIKFPDDYKHSSDITKDTEIRNATNLIRLITRIIFIWFLTEKGLVSQNLFSREKLSGIVKDFMKASNFYNAILQNLFFGTLNQKMDERKFAQEGDFLTNRKEYGVKNLYRYSDKFLISKNEVLELFKDIPFLNGGLFDCLDKDMEKVYIDGFSRNPAKQSSIPDYLFFQQGEERVDLSGYGLSKGRPVRGLIEILSGYNFTIDENTPVDQEIALDPELLGKVFENLLASYNPETATTARKATGSYYTPREIVDYMVSESLVAYLENGIKNNYSVGAEPRVCPNINGQPQGVAPTGLGEHIGLPLQGYEERLRQLLSYSDEIPDFSDEEKQKIISDIDNVKILDPACGSGAFPMGVLHKLVYVLQKLDPENRYWHELQYQKALKETEEAFKLGDKKDREDRLKEINEAFDEGINYPDYARKLYLIENCIYGVDIQPIAIQISKLRFFISLILDQKVDRSKENLAIRALPNLETKFVAANTLVGLDRPHQVAFRNPEIEKKEHELKELRHKYFTASTRTQKMRYQEKDKKIREQIANLLINDGWGDAAAKKIAAFDLYDQNASADWFDPEWMFGIKNPSPLAGEGKGEGGFDIVIGNPPYVSALELKKRLPEKEYSYLKQSYETAKGTVDCYIYFFERGIKLLKDEGSLAYISPNRYLSASYGKALREYIYKNTTLNSIVDYSDVRVFEEASTYPILSFLTKRRREFYKILIGKYSEKDNKLDFKDITSQKLNSLDDHIWGFLLNEKLALTEKVILQCVPLNEVCRINATSTASEADEYHSLINEKGGYKLINTGTIDRYKTTWGIEQLTDKGKKYLHPYLPINSKKISSNRHHLYSSPKIIFAKIALTAEAFYDNEGIYASTNTNCLHTFSDEVDPRYILAWVNSKLFQYTFECFFDGLKMQGGYLLYSSPNLSSMYIKKCDKNSQQPFITLVDQILAAKNPPSPPFVKGGNDECSPLCKGGTSISPPLCKRGDRGDFMDTSALERQIDEIVYKLYGLTEDEIEIVEGRV